MLLEMAQVFQGWTENQRIHNIYSDAKLAFYSFRFGAAKQFRIQLTKKKNDTDYCHSNVERIADTQINVKYFA